MPEIGVVAYQMTHLDEAKTLVPFSFLLLYAGKRYCQKRPNMPPNRSWNRLWDAYETLPIISRYLIYLFIYLHIQRHPQQKRWLLMSRWLWYDRNIFCKGGGEDRDGWKLREATASAAAANWRDAHMQMLKRIGKGVNLGPKTKHIMTKIMLNMNVKSLIGVVSFRYSLRFHIGSLMPSARISTGNFAI